MDSELVWYKKLDEATGMFKSPRFLMARVTDGRVAWVKPSWVKPVGMADGVWYMATSKTKELRLDGLSWYNKEGETR